MKKVLVYTTTYCPYCIRAKQLLQRKSILFEEILVDPSNEQQWADLYARSKMKTVPQIFFGDQCIGGFDDLAALERSGKLDRLLA